MSSQVRKPITIVADEFLHNVVGLINASGLPYFIVESILNDCIKDVHTASLQQLNMDKEEFLKMTKEAEIKTQYEKASNHTDAD